MIPSTSRERVEMLERIRQTQAASDLKKDYAAIPREYVQTGMLDEAERVSLFEDRLRDYEAGVYRCSPDELPKTIETALLWRGKKLLIVPAALPRELLPASLEFRGDEDLNYQELDLSEGVLTGCALAIAATGTIVLRHSKSEGRRALTLIPDYHLCIVYVHQIVETVVEGVRIMAQFAGTPLTTVSGPSATSDIEMTRIKGVHGPRVLDVIIVNASPQYGEKS